MHDFHWAKHKHFIYTLCQWRYHLIGTEELIIPQIQGWVLRVGLESCRNWAPVLVICKRQEQLWRKTKPSSAVLLILAWAERRELSWGLSQPTRQLEADLHCSSAALWDGEARRGVDAPQERRQSWFKFSSFGEEKPQSQLRNSQPLCKAAQTGTTAAPETAVRFWEPKVLEGSSWKPGREATPQARMTWREQEESHLLRLSTRKRNTNPLPLFWCGIHCLLCRHDLLPAC